jgi:tetratricopeptide (TPR) repeat protein
MPALGWALLKAAQNDRSVDSFYRELGKIFEDFEEVPALAYVARYEHARALHRIGRNDEAREAFAKLHADALKAGFLPPIDADFLKAFQPNKRQEEWRALMRKAARQLVEEDARPAVIGLSWQARQVGDQALGNELFKTATADVRADEDLATVFAMVEYLYHTGRHAEADAALRPVLDIPICARWPALWRLAAKLAEPQGHTARALEYQERSTLLKHERHRKAIPLEMVRNDYRGLLDRYRQLAESVTTDDMQPSQELLGRIVRVADRWRVADPEPKEACHTAARIFSNLGAAELAWDYVTTPLAAEPAKAVPWKELAEELRQQVQLDLAERVYASAFAAEPGNPQHLWDRAQVLFQAERPAEARQLLKQIAEGPWPPAHQALRSQAQKRLHEQ